MIVENFTFLDADKEKLLKWYQPFVSVGNVRLWANRLAPFKEQIDLHAQMMRMSERVYDFIIPPELKIKIEKLRSGKIDILTIENQINAVENSKSAVSSTLDFLHLVWAQALGSEFYHSLKTNTVDKSNDDNAHQDSILDRRERNDWYNYKPADYTILSCESPGENKNISTLFFDLTELFNQLSSDTQQILQSPLFAPNSNKEKVICNFDNNRTLPKESFSPLIIKSEAGDVFIDRRFQSNFLFSAGYMRDFRMIFKNQAAFDAINKLGNIFPEPTPHTFDAVWKPGMTVIARQNNIFHRRYNPDPTKPSNGRLLTRATILTDRPVALGFFDSSYRSRATDAALRKETLDLFQKYAVGELAMSSDKPDVVRAKDNAKKHLADMAGVDLAQIVLQP